MSAAGKTDALKLLNVGLDMNPLTDEARAFFGRFPVGGVCLFRGSLDTLEGVMDLLRELRSLLGPGALISVDQEGGSVVRLPQLPVSPGALALGVGDNPARTYRVALSQARGLAALGFNVNYAPVLDVNINPDNPVIGERAFGASPERVIRHALPFARAHRGAGVLAVGKHYPGHGDTAVDSHLSLPVLDRSWAQLEATELRPFRAAIEDGLEAIMTAHIAFPRLSGEPATLSSELLGHLRGALGFDGLIFTDALDMGAILQRMPQHASAALSLAAGADIALVLGDLKLHAETAAAFDPDPADVRRSLTRLERTLERYPFREPDPGALRALLNDPVVAGDVEDAARAALRRQGELPQIARSARVALLLPSDVRKGAATDAEDVGARLTPPLRAVFPKLRVLRGRDALSPDLAGVDAAILVSASRTEPLASEREIAERLAQLPQALHFNLFNPHLSADFPLPTLLTFGYRDASLRAAASALIGNAAVPAWQET